MGSPFLFCGNLNSGCPAPQSIFIRIYFMRIVFATLICCALWTQSSFAQTVALANKTSPNVEFTFNTINEYVNGITLSNVLTLNIDASLTQWDLYVGATSASAGEWDATTHYSNLGAPPDVGLMQVRFRNASNTSLVSGFFPLTDIAAPTHIIGDYLSPDLPISCDDVSPAGTNMAGDYLSRPECYKFNVDLRITPGLTYRAGLYTMRIDFILAPDL